MGLSKTLRAEAKGGLRYWIFPRWLVVLDVLKLDVQGAELEVLKGAGSLLKGVQLIQLEAWFRREYWGRTPVLDEIIEFLEINDFRLFDLGECFFDHTHELFAADVYFARSELLQRQGSRLPRAHLFGE